MKKSTTLFLQVLVILIGVAAVVFLIWEPQVEGVNIHATKFEIYFKDPFLAYAYIASIPFFVALYQTFKVLGHAGQSAPFSESTTRALRTIQYCAVAIIGFVIVGEIWLLSSSNDDRPPIVMMGALVTLCSITVAVAAAKFRQALSKAA